MSATTNRPQYVRRNYAASQAGEDGSQISGAESGITAGGSRVTATSRPIGTRVAQNPRLATGQPGTTSPAGATAGARLATDRASALAERQQAGPGLGVARTQVTAGQSRVANPGAAVGDARAAASSTLASRRAYAAAPGSADNQGAAGAGLAANRAIASRAPVARDRSGTGAPPSADPSAAGQQTPRGSNAEDMSFRRRPSQLVLEREKKTDYWQDVADAASQNGAKLNGEDLNKVISRAMSLGIVGDRKQRESVSGPKATELFEKLQNSMAQKITDLTGGKVVDVDALVNQNASLMEKIMVFEKTISALEQKKNAEEEEEKKKVQSKIGELERSLKALEAQKREQREQNRRTMKLEIANLKEMMTKVQQTQTATVAADQATAAAAAGSGDAKGLAAKMNRLEAALRLMNEERKKDKVEDKETILLRRKLALFETKLKDMEEEKKLKEDESQGNALRDKLLLMEDKLAKMERRKSVSMTMVMQQKMEQVEKQLAMLRTQKDVPAADEGNNKITQKMALLEKQLKDMAQQKVTPGMINDDETNQLRGYIQKLEGSIMGAEKRMEDQRKKIEEERRLNYEKRAREEEEFRRQARQKEEELLKRIAQMESRIKTGGGGGSLDPAILDRLKALESGGGGGGGGGDSQVNNKIIEMEKRLMETQKMLEEERKVTRNILEGAQSGNTESAGLESWQKDAQIEWLKKANEQLFAKIQATNDLIDKKMEDFKNMKPTGGGAVHRSGLSYEEINQKLAELQAKLFDPNTDERESEQLNIDYEKLISELEGTPEYQKEQEELKNKWKVENAPINKAAFEQQGVLLSAMGDQKLTAILGRKPELRLIMRTPDQILKMHTNDFKTLSTQNLSEEEARALYHNMPVFTKDKEKQCEWVQQLQTKIETEMSKPKVKAPPPIPKKKAVVIKKAAAPSGGGGGGGSGGGFLDELIAKRKRRD